MAVGDVKLGLECKMYLGTPALSDTTDPDEVTWTEFPKIKDLKRDGTKDEADISTRATGIFKAKLPTLADAGVTFQMFDDGGADYATMRAAWFGNTTLTVAIMNGDIETAGTSGVVGNYRVKDFSETQNLTEGATADVALSHISQCQEYVVSGS